MFLSTTVNADIPLTGEEKHWLDEHGDQVILWFDSHFPPIEFLEQDGSFQGVGADVIALIEKRLGVSFIKKPSPSWPEHLNALKKGEIHIAPVIVHSDERSVYAFFSKPYITIPLVIITHKNKKKTQGLDSFNGKRIAVVTGYQSEKHLQKNFPSKFEIVTVANVSEGLRDVAFGVVDAFVGNLATAAYYIDKDNLPNLRVAGTAGYEYKLSFAVNKNFPLLFSAMEKALASLSQDDIASIRDKWIALDNQGLLSREEKQFLQFALRITIVLLIILLIIAWGLKQKLKRKKIDLDIAEKAVIDQKSRLNLAIKATQAAIWELSPQTGEAVFSEDWYTILGYSPKEVSSHIDEWIALTQPDDKNKTLEILNKYIDEGGIGVYESQFRMRHKNGEWRWILGKGQAVEWDKQGNPIRMIGLNIDIHKQKQAEKALQESEAISTALFNQAFNFFALLDLDGNILRVNDSALESLAFEQDLTGHSFWEAPWWKDKEKALSIGREAMKTVKKGDTFRKEVTLINEQGYTRYIDFALSPLKNSSGEILYMIPEGRDITEYREALSQIEKSEQRFKSIFDNAPYSIVINSFEDGKYLDVNKAYLKTRGITKDQALAMEPEQISMLSLEEQALMRERIRKGGLFNMESRSIRPDNSVAHVLYSAVPIPFDDKEAILSMIVDVTDKKNAEDALKASEKKFSELFMLSPDSIILSDFETDKVLEINDSFLNVFGYKRDAIIGRSIVDLSLFVTPSDREKIYEEVKANGKVQNMELQLYKADGEITSQLISGRQMTINGDQVLLTIGRDITELKKVESMMIQTEKMVSLGGIAAGIAHEINNPLGIILQASQNLQQRSRPDFPKNQQAAVEIGLDLNMMAQYMKVRKLDEFIEDIRDAAVRAADIISRMLLFSRKSESQRTVCNISTIIDDAISLAKNDFDLKKSYDFKQIKLNLSIEKDLPGINCTETEIEQVLLNLLRNAAQAMAEMETPPPEPRIDIRVFTSEKTMHIEVSDNGPGMTDEIKKRIMEPFFTTKGTGVGTGLGLSVSYFIITRGHNGIFKVSSEPGAGTTFTIELPYE